MHLDQERRCALGAGIDFDAYRLRVLLAGRRIACEASLAHEPAGFTPDAARSAFVIRRVAR